MSNQNVVFKQSGATLDTGEEDAAAIRPIEDGEIGVEATFQRPSENLRLRSEILRDETENLKYLSDADRALLVSGGGNITWNGTVAGGGGGNGKFTLTADLVIRPFLAPAASTKAQATTRGVRFETILSPVGSINPPRSYSGANKISVEIVGTPGAVLAVAVDGTPADNVTVTIDTTPVTGTTKSQLITFLTTNLGAGAVAFRNLGLTAVLASGAGSDVLIASGAIDPNTDFKVLAGAADAEKHVITAAGLASFFAASAGANVMIEGDVICIQYDTLVNGAGGGRRESIADAPESSSNADANLFNLRLFPERLPLAIPVATVNSNVLRLIDGTLLVKDVSAGLGGGYVPTNGGTMTGALLMSGVNIEPVTDNSGAKLGTSSKRFVETNAVLGSFNTLESTAGGVLGSASTSAKRYVAHLSSLVVYDAGGVKPASNGLTLGDSTNRFTGHLEDLNIYGANGVRPAITNTNDIGSTSLRFRKGWFVAIETSGAATLGSIVSGSIATAGVTGALGAVTSAATRYNAFLNTLNVLSTATFTAGLTVAGTISTDGTNRTLGASFAGSRFTAHLQNATFYDVGAAGDNLRNVLNGRTLIKAWGRVTILAGAVDGANTELTNCTVSIVSSKLRVTLTHSITNAMYAPGVSIVSTSARYHTIGNTGSSTFDIFVWDSAGSAVDLASGNHGIMFNLAGRGD